MRDDDIVVIPRVGDKKAQRSHDAVDTVCPVCKLACYMGQRTAQFLERHNDVKVMCLQCALDLARNVDEIEVFYVPKTQ